MSLVVPFMLGVTEIEQYYQLMVDIPSTLMSLNIILILIKISALIGLIFNAGFFSSLGYLIILEKITTDDYFLAIIAFFFKIIQLG